MHLLREGEPMGSAQGPLSPQNPVLGTCLPAPRALCHAAHQLAGEPLRASVTCPRGKEAEWVTLRVGVPILDCHVALVLVVHVRFP